MNRYKTVPFTRRRCQETHPWIEAEGIIDTSGLIATRVLRNARKLDNRVATTVEFDRIERIAI